mgnify:CR=1 FL=1
MNPLILIPARMAATRLPNKPLADIGGRPMIVRAWAQAAASGLPVAVAAGDPEIVEAVEAVNAPPEFMMGKKLIESRRPVDPIKLADPAVSMKDVAA